MPTTILTEFRILVYFDKLSAIDFPCNGIFSLTTTINGSNNEVDTVRVRLDKFLTITRGITEPPKNNYNIFPPKEKDSKTFQHRTFCVSHPGEVIPLRDVAVFTVDIRSVSPKFFCKQLSFDFELYYSPSRKIKEWSDEFIVSKTRYVVNNIYLAKSTPKRLLFHQTHFCSIDSYFQFSLISQRIVDFTSMSTLVGQVDYKGLLFDLMNRSYKNIQSQYTKIVDDSSQNELRKSNEDNLEDNIIIVENKDENNNNNNNNNNNVRKSTGILGDHQSLIESVFDSKSVLPDKEATKFWNNELEIISIEIIKIWGIILQYLIDNGCCSLNRLMPIADEAERVIFLENVFSEVMIIESNDIRSACEPFVRDSNIIRGSNHFQNNRAKLELFDHLIDLSSEHSPILFEQHLQWDLSQKFTIEENLKSSKFPDGVKFVHSQSENSDSTIYNLNTWKRKLPNKHGKKKGRKSSAPIQLSSLRNSTDQLSPPNTSGSHLVVFVHGFQGTHLDMAHLKNYLQALNQENTEYLLVSSIVDQTHQSIDSLGELVADEIVSYMSKNFLVITRISFVSHSMGAIVSRAALRSPKMAPHLNKLFTFVSLAGPHLGLWFSNSLISSGMKIWKKWASSESLDELGMTDEESFEDCFLYKLSTSQEFGYFHNYLFFGSRQDKYSPFPSSVVTLDSSLDPSNSKYIAYLSMALNIHNIIKAEQKNIVRINVCFSEQQMSNSGFSGKIGRTAHVTILQSDTFLQLFASIYKQFL